MIHVRLQEQNVIKSMTFIYHTLVYNKFSTLAIYIRSRYLLPRMGRFKGEAGDSYEKSGAVAQL